MDQGGRGEGGGRREEGGRRKEEGSPPHTPRTRCDTHLPVILLAHSGAERCHVLLAGGTQAVVEPVVLVHLVLVAVHLVAAYPIEALVTLAVLQAPGRGGGEGGG